MKKNIYKLFSNAKRGFFALALIIFLGTAYSQTTYTFVYTGSSQNISLPAGNYSIECWGADGGKGYQTSQIANSGRGGYSSGILNLTIGQTIYIYAGGAGTDANGTTVGQICAGGFNGGGASGANNYVTTTSYRAGGGGGGTDVRVGGTALSNRVIVAGAGGGGVYSISYPGGNGGGASGGNGGNTYNGGGGTQLAGGLASGSTGNIIGTNGALGLGGDGGTAASKSGGGGGGGGYYGGGGGATGNSSSSQGGGGGGSGYIGGVTSGTTIMFGQTGYVANPDLTGNGRVLITELCSITIFSSGTNTSNPSICSGQSLTLTTNATSNYSWSTGQTTSSIVVAPTTNTVYSLAATSSLACNANASKSVSVTSGLPVMSISNPSNTICPGQTATLTASGAATYTWMNSGVVNGQSFTPSSTTIYTVNGQNPCGVASATTAITVTPVQITVSATSTLVCQGVTTTLTAASSVSNYTWYPTNSTGITAIIAPASSMVYTVFGSDGTCSGTETVTINTKPSPTITIVSSAPAVCEGQSLTMSVNGASTYTWMPGNVNGNTITVSPSTSTLYVVTGENTVGCTSTQQQLVVVDSPPIININANPTLLCSGATATITASGGDSYVWTGGPSTAIYVTTVNATTVFTVTGSHITNTCTTEKTVTISAIVPNLTLPTNTNVCAGKSVTVFASGANNYSWNSTSTGNIGVYTTQPAQSLIVTLIATTSTLSVNCPVTHTFAIVVNPLPTLSVSPQRETICKNETNTLSVSGAQNYTWTGGSSNSILIITPTITGQTYTVLGIDANGCDNTTSYQAIVSSCTGLSEVSKSLTGILVYPNPSEGNFSIQSDRPLELLLINALGQKTSVISLNVENNFKYEVRDLIPGIYFVADQNSSSNNATKIIVH
ncbi:glycine-rich protein [Aurantibacillus circumpalustris]|uniref:glycine-rich protein n=1 Tax=Aurantibacillus circumpalustris TaxID=3036359 RepID=UPI00295B1C21|nr:glycine-rich protein [Aurantibacillus circumpalustris]